MRTEERFWAKVAIGPGCWTWTDTPISRALFAELEGVDTRSVSKLKWDQIIKSHLALERRATAAESALQRAQGSEAELAAMLIRAERAESALAIAAMTRALVRADMSDTEACEHGVALFSSAMLEKLKLKRDEGRAGWHTDDCSNAVLWEMLLAHVNTANPDAVDIANFCMMMWNRALAAKERK